MKVKLTDRFCAGVKPDPAKQTEYYDAATIGLVLRVNRDGSKSWNYSFTFKGKSVRAPLGTYPATSLAGARTLAMEARAHVEEGRDPRAVLASQNAGTVTVAMLCESWLEKHVRPNLDSAPNIEQRLNKNVLPIIGSIRLADLHKRDVNKVTDKIVKRGAPVEANRVFENVRAMLRWAAARGDLDRSPIEAMPKPARESAARDRHLSHEEIRHLWAILPTALPMSKACQRIVRLCLVTGQRVGEISGMRTDELDMKARLWSLPGSRVKNDEAHTVPLSDMALSVIRDAIADGGDSTFVFPSGDAGIDPHGVATTLRRAQKRFGMPQWSAHDLRRTAITGLAELGVMPIVIGAVANHLSVTKASVTFISYVKHSFENEKRQALELWADHLAAIIGGDATATILPMRKPTP